MFFHWNKFIARSSGAKRIFWSFRSVNIWSPTGPKSNTAKKPRVSCENFKHSTLARFFSQHILHNPDLSALPTVDIRREIK